MQPSAQSNCGYEEPLVGQVPHTKTHLQAPFASSWRPHHIVGTMLMHSTLTLPSLPAARGRAALASRTQSAQRVAPINAPRRSIGICRAAGGDPPPSADTSTTSSVDVGALGGPGMGDAWGTQDDCMCWPSVVRTSIQHGCEARRQGGTVLPRKCVRGSVRGNHHHHDCHITHRRRPPLLPVKPGRALRRCHEGQLDRRRLPAATCSRQGMLMHACMQHGDSCIQGALRTDVYLYRWSACLHMPARRVKACIACLRQHAIRVW